MNSRPELPALYYLTHFKEFLSEFDHSHHLLREDERKFLNSFYHLSEPSQCLYVRMVNRKGRVFQRREFTYKEITDVESGFKELFSAGFIRPVQDSDKEEVYLSLKKHQILEALIEENIPVKKSASKPQLLALALERSLSLSTERFEDLFLQEKTSEMTYLLFLYFGKIMQGLSLYTLRDLGIKRMNKYQGKYKPRFSNLTEAESHYFFALLKEDVSKAGPLESWPQPMNPESRVLKNKILLDLALLSDSAEQTIQFLKASNAHPAREKLVRLLFKNEAMEECETILQEMISHPWEEEEALFAEDFLQRKFGKKRISALTERLRSSRLISIDECYFRHPEIGAIDYLSSEGWTAYHTENHFWNLFFGLLFWEEIFCHSGAGFRNSFELLPADLLNGTFYANHEAAIENKFERLDDADWTWNFILSMAKKYQDEQLGIFTWDEDSLKILCQGISLITSESQRIILRTMAKDYSSYCSGFTDLIAFKNQDVIFIEVKATGDSLKQSQMKMMNLLSSAGLQVDLLRVDYFHNPDQVYTVVDLETTGGRADWDRITEIGAVKFRGGVILERFQSLVNPGRSIPKFIQELTGITNEMVRAAPSFEEIAESFRAFSEGSIFVAHNVNFDYKFLQKEYERLEERFVRPFICTKAQMKKYYPKLVSYSLKELTREFGIPLENHHRALSDAEAAAGLLRLINEKRS